MTRHQKRILFDPKACFSQPMADIYCDYFIEKTLPLTNKCVRNKGPYAALQQDVFETHKYMH